MQIIYQQNPLAAKIILEEHEKKEIYYKIKIEQILECASEAEFELNPKNDKFFAGLLIKNKEKRLKDALDALDQDYLDDTPESGLNKRVQILYDHYISELDLDHIGDCTCFPSSCSKCHLEHLLGIDTIKGLNKHEAYKIEMAFRKVKTCDDAIAYLKNEEYSEENKLSPYYLKWKKESANALIWLIDYKETKLKGDSHE